MEDEPARKYRKISGRSPWAFAVEDLGTTVETAGVKVVGEPVESDDDDDSFHTAFEDMHDLSQNVYDLLLYRGVDWRAVCTMANREKGQLRSGFLANCLVGDYHDVPSKDEFISLLTCLGEGAGPFGLGLEVELSCPKCDKIGAPHVPHYWKADQLRAHYKQPPFRCVEEAFLRSYDYYSLICACGKFESLFFLWSYFGADQLPDWSRSHVDAHILRACLGAAERFVFEYTRCSELVLPSQQVSTSRDWRELMRDPTYAKKWCFLVVKLASRDGFPSAEVSPDCKLNLAASGEETGAAYVFLVIKILRRVFARQRLSTSPGSALPFMETAVSSIVDLMDYCRESGTPMFSYTGSTMCQMLQKLNCCRGGWFRQQHVCASTILCRVLEERPSNAQKELVSVGLETRNYGLVQKCLDCSPALASHPDLFIELMSHNYKPATPSEINGWGSGRRRTSHQDALNGIQYMTVREAPHHMGSHSW